MILTDELNGMNPGEIAGILDKMPPEEISDIVAEATDEQCSILFEALAHPPQHPAPEFPPSGEAFGYRNGDRIIAVLHPWGDNWRITKFMADGPTGHVGIADGDLETLERELRWNNLTRDDSALAELDAWTQTEEWEQGVIRLLILQAWNACSFGHRMDLSHEIDEYYAAHTPEETLAWLPIIYRRLRKGT